MKKYFLAIFALYFCILNLYAGGGLNFDLTPERDRLTSPFLQLRVVNLTNNTVNFYYNRLHSPNILGSQQEFITRNEPINDFDFPGFIGIGCAENTDIIIYQIVPLSLTVGIRNLNMQCIIIIHETGINIIDGIIDETIDFSDDRYLAENLISRKNDFRFELVDTNRGNINVIFENRSGIQMRVSIFSNFTQNPQHYYLENEMNEVYTVDRALFNLGNIHVMIREHRAPVWVGPLYRIRLYERETENIKIIIKKSGYEIIYE